VILFLGELRRKTISLGQNTFFWEKAERKPTEGWSPQDLSVKEQGGSAMTLKRRAEGGKILFKTTNLSSPSMMAGLKSCQGRKTLVYLWKKDKIDYS